MLCVRCGREFRPYYQKRFCTWVCAAEAKLEREREERRKRKPILRTVHRVCAYRKCQKPFTAEHPNQIYCSKRCCVRNAHSDGAMEAARRERFFEKVGGREAYYAKRHRQHLEKLAGEPGYAERVYASRLLARRRTNATKQIAQFGRLIEAIDDAKGADEDG